MRVKWQQFLPFDKIRSTYFTAFLQPTSFTNPLNDVCSRLNTRYALRQFEIELIAVIAEFHNKKKKFTKRSQHPLDRSKCDGERTTANDDDTVHEKRVHSTS